MKSWNAHLAIGPTLEIGDAPMARRQIFRRLELAARHKLPAIYHYSKRRPIDGGELAAARPRGAVALTENESSGVTI